jgi:hypothetical protein
VETGLMSLVASINDQPRNIILILRRSGRQVDLGFRTSRAIAR